MFSLRKSAFALLALLAVSGAALAYLPENCADEPPEVIFGKCEAAVTGRVIGFHRDECKIKNSLCFVYSATIKIGATYKGKLAAGQEISIPVGMYLQSGGEDNTVPTELCRYISQSPLPLEINGVYLLLLNDKSDSDLHTTPVCILTNFNYGIYRLCEWTSGDNAEQGKIKIYPVAVTVRREKPGGEPVLLETFLEKMAGADSSSKRYEKK
jgi:hypothetical protein